MISKLTNNTTLTLSFASERGKKFLTLNFYAVVINDLGKLENEKIVEEVKNIVEEWKMNSDIKSLYLMFVDRYPSHRYLNKLVKCQYFITLDLATLLLEIKGT